MQHLLARVLLIALATTAQKNNAGTELAKCTARATEDVILFVDDYITKGKPVQEGVQKAVDAAIAATVTTENSSTALLFTPFKEYRMASSNATAHTPIVRISGAHPSLRIDGCGANFVITTPQAGVFSISTSRKLTISNITIDYDPLPMTQGYVTAVASATRYTVQLSKGFPSLMMPHFKASTSWVVIKDKKIKTRHKLGSMNMMNVDSWTDLGGGKFNIKLQYGFTNHTVVGPAVGDPVAHLARYDQYPTFGVQQCDYCTFEAVTIHASPSGTWIVIQSDGVVVRNVKVEPKKGRFHTTNADGVFVLDSRVGTTVVDSSFIAIGDDGFVVKTFSASCTERHAGGSRFTLSGMNLPLPGDVLRVWNPSNISSGLPAVRAVVKSAEGSWGNMNVTFTKPLPSQIVCTKLRNDDVGNGSSVVASSSLGGISGATGSVVSKESDKVVGFEFANDNQTGPGFKFARNTMQSRRFGVLCMGKDGVIEDNRFVDNPGPAVLLINDDDYDDPREARMGWMPRNISIVRNTILRNSRCSPNPWHTGTAASLVSVITMAVVGPHGELPPAPFQRVGYRGVDGITIENNTIDTWYRGPAIRIGETHQLWMKNNTITGPPLAPSTVGASSGSQPSPAVIIADADTIVVEHNTFAGGWKSLKETIQVQRNTTSQINISGNTLHH